MRVVLDSNVLVAAFATHGVCHEIFEYCLRNTTLLCSDFISGEVERILIHKIKTPPKMVSEITRYLKSQTQWIVPEQGALGSLRDPSDYMIIATALSGNADYLITGDKDLLVLKEVKRIVIVSPRNFWIRCQEI